MLQSLFAATTSYNYYTTTTTSTSSGISLGTFMAIYGIVLLIMIPLVIIPMWKIFQKAGRPGWAAIVPIYNTWVLFEIVGYPGWWALLSLVPFVSIFPAVMSIVAYYKLAKLFGKSDGFAVCMIFFPIVCIPILGYGKATFNGQLDSNQQNPGGPVPYDPSSAAPVESTPALDSPQPIVISQNEQPIQPAQPVQDIAQAHAQTDTPSVDSSVPPSSPTPTV